MAAHSAKHEVLTFRADRSILAALRGVRNRSEFIRAAVLAALDSACPLCLGTGILTPNQRTHWQTFAANHALRECRDCHEFHLVCGKAPAPGRHPRAG